LQTFLKVDLEEKAAKPVIWCGDLNVAHQEIDICNPKGKEKQAGFTKEERESFSNFLAKGFVDTFRHFNPSKTKYSYWNLRSGARAKNQGWRLDYFVVSRSLLTSTDIRVVSSEINNELNGSDHCPISLLLEL
jgi:exodeoxyribonuclease III